MSLCLCGYRPRRNHLLAACLFAAATALPLPAADWPQWGRTNDRNMVSDENNLPDSFDPGLQFIIDKVLVPASTTRPEQSSAATRAAARAATTSAPATEPARLIERYITKVIHTGKTTNIKWTAKLGNQSYGNVAVANGRIYVGTTNSPRFDPKYADGRDVLLCLDEATGKLLWLLPAPRGPLDLGLCSHPTVDGDRVYTVTNTLDILCLDAKGLSNGNDGPFQDEAKYFAAKSANPVTLGPTDADILWRFDAAKQFPATLHDAAGGAPLVLGDLLYVSLSSVNSPKKSAPTILVLDKNTGQAVARDDQNICAFHNQWSSPSTGKVGDKTLLFFGGGDGVCYAFDTAITPGPPNGPGTLQTVWKFDLDGPQRRFHDGKPQQYASKTGPIEIIATPVFLDNRVYVALGQDPTHSNLANGRLVCIDATKTGDLTEAGPLWSFDAIGSSISTVAIHDGLLYTADLLGNIYCLDAKTGVLQWSHKEKGQIWGSPLVADGKVYIGTGRGKMPDQGTLLIFAEGREKKLLAQIKLDASICASPIAANGTLYIATGGTLYAIETEKKP